MRPFRSFRKTVIGLICLLVMVSTLGIGLPLVLRIFNEAKSSDRELLDQKTKTISYTLGQELSVLKAKLDSMAKSSDILLGATNRVVSSVASHELEKLLNATPLLHGVFILDHDRGLMVSEPPRYQGDRELLRLIAGETGADEKGVNRPLRTYFHKDDRGNMTISLVQPLYDDFTTEEFLGYLVGQVSLEDLFTHVFALANITEAQAILETTMGNLKLGRYSGQALAMSIGQWPINKDETMTVRMVSSSSHYSTNVSTLLKWFLIYGSVMLLLVIVCAILITRILIRPVDQITQAIEGYAQGDQFGQQDPPSFEEFAGVLRTLRKMDRRIRNFISRIKEQAKIEADLKSAERSRKIAEQLAHDIRSPLAVLDGVSEALPQIPEEDRVVLRRALARIKGIANDLLAEKPTHGERPQAVLISHLLDMMVTETRVRSDRADVTIDLDIAQDALGLFFEDSKGYLPRVLSNLVNNACHAVSGKGRVTITCRCLGPTEFQIQVSDDGCGMSPDVLERAFENGFSHGKSDGAGLGLFDAQVKVSQLGGQLTLESKVGVGTQVSLTLPIVDCPNWFQESLAIEQGDYIVCLDDDPNLHNLFKRKFSDLGLELKSFSDIDSFKEFVVAEGLRSIAWCFIDFELIGSGQNGLDVIQDLKIGLKSTLVTSRFDEVEVQNRAGEMGIKILPKFLVPQAAVKNRYSSIVLLDDDSGIRYTWRRIAKNQGHSLSTFSSFDELLPYLPGMSQDCLFFIDQQLGDDVPGTSICAMLQEMGFSKVYLTTGYEADAFAGLEFEVVGKGYPHRLVSTGGRSG